MVTRGNRLIRGKKEGRCGKMEEGAKSYRGVPASTEELSAVSEVWAGKRQKRVFDTKGLRGKEEKENQDPWYTVYKRWA